MLMQRPLAQVNWVRGKQVGYAVERKWGKEKKTTLFPFHFNPDRSEAREVQSRRLTAGVGLVGAVAAVVVQVAGPGDGDAAAAGAGVLVGRAGASWRPVTTNSQVSDPLWYKKIIKVAIFPELIAGKASYTVAF